MRSLRSIRIRSRCLNSHKYWNSPWLGRQALRCAAWKKTARRRYRGRPPANRLGLEGGSWIAIDGTPRVRFRSTLSDLVRRLDVLAAQVAEAADADAAGKTI